jgi:UDP-N-acetylmuramoyl-L-alanyl-D-glutamate--2,6-diaminopimelate ligase
MRLDALLAAADLPAAGISILDSRGDLSQAEIGFMTLDSRAVEPGTLYCCVPGHRLDGHVFAADAVAAGAVALLCQRPMDLDVPQVIVTAVRPAVAPLAAVLYGRPSEAMTVVGITGTNGKTTTAQLLASIFQAAGRETAALGTLSGVRTTPEAPVLQARLAELRRGGVTAVAMEVSSHALTQHRVDAVHFVAAVFTNLSQDHLDYHHTMAEYFEAKAGLFAPDRTELAVVNRDDGWGRQLLERLATSGLPVEPFSLDDVTDLRLGVDGSHFRWDGVALTVRLGGRFNISNALAAATTARALGIGGSAIRDGLAAVESVHGRFEPVRAGQPFTVLVDYAHTPDGLEQALIAAREMAGAGHIIVVFGCGGDRDREKRPLMGKVATALADLAVLTSDNPRSEDPDRIIADVKDGAEGPGQLVIVADRARAISRALTTASPGDVVVIAGKGHETGQEIGGRTIPFDDAEVARGVLGRIVGATE